MVWGAFLKRAEIYTPCIAACIPAAVACGRHFFSSSIYGKLYEARRGGKARTFTEEVEEMILDELTLFVEQPGKDVLSIPYTIHKRPLSSEYRLFVGDDLRGVTIGYPRGFTDGCFVGVPFNITYRTVDDVATDCQNLKFAALSSPTSWWSRYFSGRGKVQEILWGSEAGVKIMESLVLSNDAKRFLIQKLIHEGDVNYGLGYDGFTYLFPGVAVASINYNYKKWMNSRYRRFVKRPSLWPLYALTGIVGLMVVDQLRKMTRTRVDLAADRDTAKIGETYIRGGIEYYEKALQRNRCLNQMAQQAGLKKIYTDDGDYIPHYVRKPYTSLKERLKMIRQVEEDSKKPPQ